MLESLSDVGSKDASGELLGDPVDMGEGDDAGAGAAELGTVGAAGAEPSRRSKNGFLLLLGDENGFVLPIVANFCPVLNGLLFLIFSLPHRYSKHFFQFLPEKLFPPRQPRQPRSI